MENTSNVKLSQELKCFYNCRSNFSFFLCFQTVGLDKHKKSNQHKVKGCKKHSDMKCSCCKSSMERVGLHDEYLIHNRMLSSILVLCRLKSQVENQIKEKSDIQKQSQYFQRKIVSCIHLWMTKSYFIATYHVGLFFKKKQSASFFYKGFYQELNISEISQSCYTKAGGSRPPPERFICVSVRCV